MEPHDAPSPAPTIYLVAIDGTPRAVAALDVASTLATALGGHAELHIVHVVDVTPAATVTGVGMSVEPVMELAEVVKIARDVVDRACSEAAGRFMGRIVGHLAAGYPWSEIVQAAATLNADLIVVGTAGRTGFERLALGSVAEKVVRHAGCPVLVARPNEHRPQGAITRPGAPLTPASV